LSVRRPAVN